MDGLTYKGIHSDNFGLSIRTEPSILPPIATQIIQIPNMPGAYYQSSSYGMRPINVPVGIVFNDASDFQSKLRDLATWLKPENDIYDMPLVFDMETDKTYYAVLTGNTDLPKIARTGQGTLSFIAPDPFAYGQETQPQTINDPSGGTVDTTITNGGTEETYPKFTCTFTKATPVLSIISPDSAIILGKPATVEETVLDEKEQVFWDQLDTTTNWMTGTDIDDNGVVAGTMSSNGYELHADAYGTNANGWHGPALVHSLATAITDFEVSVLLSQLNDTASIGRAEVYCMDINGNEFAKIAMRDGHATFKKNYGQVKIGGNLVLNTTGARWDTWNDFDGILTIGRRGKTWYYYIAKIINGKRDSEYYGEWVDEDGLYAADLGKVQLHLGAHEGIAPTNQYFKDVKIYKFNDLTETQVPNIAQVGDVIEIDHGKRTILLNGKDARYLKDFTSDWFTLKPGQTDLAVSPSDVAKVDETHTPRWL